MTEDLSPLVCGCDGGYINWGLSFLNPETKVVEVAYNIDLTIQDGCKLDFKGDDWMSEIIDRWTTKLAPLFKRCIRVGIEKSIRGVARPFLHVFNAHIETSLRAKFPNIQEIRIVDPHAVRKCFGTSGANYDERKDNSIESACFLDSDRERIKKQFIKDVYSKSKGKFEKSCKADDVAEASQMALYMALHPDPPAPIKIKGFKTDVEAAIEIRTIQMLLPPYPVRPDAPTKKKRKTNDKKRKAPMSENIKRKRVRAQ